MIEAAVNELISIGHKGVMKVFRQHLQGHAGILLRLVAP
jgi:hypothetical protein